MQNIPQESLEMHVINTQSPSPHRSGSTGSFAHQSRSSEETRLTTTDVVPDTGGQLLHRDRRSEHQGSDPSAAWPVTRMQEEEIQQAQNTYGPYYANALGIPCSIRSAQPNIAISTGRDGLHLQPSGHANESIIKPLLSDPGESKTCRKKSDLAAIGQAVLDVCIAATSLYFLGFAIAVSAHKGEPAAFSFADSLLKAARFGPTILPITFAAIVGRFLTAFTAWRLEHKVSLATVECLMGSRTVFGVISTPFRLKTLHLCVPFLLILWSLSPLGGQASLRVVSSGPLRTNTTVEISYLNTSSPFKVEGASGMASFQAPINAAFVGALVSPAISKSNPQDAYGNLKIPFLEDVAAHSDADSNGWYPIRDTDIEYSSMIGLPTKGLGADGTFFFRLESSYLFPVCKLSTESIMPNSPTGHSSGSASAAWDTLRSENCNNDLGMVLQLRNVSDFNSMTSPGPRKVVFGSLGDADDGTIATIATCNFSTTHVETQYTCQGKSCAPTAMRKSRITHNYAAASRQLEALTGLGTVSEIFCSMFINATGNNHHGVSSPLEQYIVNPDVPIRDERSDRRFVVADVGEALFALRFARLINTYWTIGIAPYAITGSLITSAQIVNGHNFYDYFTSSVAAQLQTTQIVLICNTAWLLVLIISSLSMLTAGAATIILNLLRRGPEILDSFTSSLRDSPFVQRDTGPSTEDGPDKSRRLANVEVMVGDVRSGEHNGYIAVAVDTKEQPVERLRPIRRYL